MVVMLGRCTDDKMDALDAKVDGLGTELLEQRKEMREQLGAAGAIIAALIAAVIAASHL